MMSVVGLDVICLGGKQATTGTDTYTDGHTLRALATTPRQADMLYSSLAQEAGAIAGRWQPTSPLISGRTR